MKLKRILATAALALGTSLITSTAFARVDVGITVGGPPPPPQVVGPVGVAGTRIYVDQRLLGLERRNVGLGWWTLGCSATRTSHLG
jgi:hypothetical protein